MERFITTLKNEIYKYVTSLLSVCTDRSANIFNECNNTHHSTIKMKPIDVKSSTYADFRIDHNDKDPEFKSDDHARI